MNKFIEWFVAKNFLSVRSGMLYVSVWMTIQASEWAEHYAEITHLSTGTDIGIVIGAATLPITGFTGFVYKFYSDSRKKSDTPNQVQ